MPTDPKRVQSVFLAAVELPDPNDRAALLDRECGPDDALRARVDALLRAHDAPDTESPPPSTDPGSSASPQTPADLTIDHDSSPDQPAEILGRPIAETTGSQIGPYRLREKLGEGGMGVVYLAEQEKPVRRRVALKIIKPGMDTEQVVARFEAERQALALMDHPSIARVLDAGATDTGRPYFVMELVKGVPITEYCDTVHLTPKERLELFLPVCAAVQHAHQKGIIHRDLKPSNVLVAMQDGKPVPKVIDFGIAKATEQRLTEKSLFTQHGAIIGTLEYMSPEQAEMSAMDVDTRTDIYALGVMLYELLTGSTPLERARLRQAGYAEILKRIKEEEPPKPSTRLSESRESLPSLAAQRRTEPSRLTRLVRGDLDWIVMKAIEKDRVRRYETANGLARDIQRFLDGDAVEACPPSARYRLGKFASKHRAALFTAGAFAFLLVAATAISVGLALRADRERVRAVAAEGRAKVQQDRAHDREQMAIDAVKRFGEAVRGHREFNVNPELAPLRNSLLKEPQAFFKRLRDRLQEDRETSPDSLARLAGANFDLGLLNSEIGDKEDALRDYQEALAIRDRLARENPSVPRYRSDVAGAHNNIGEMLRQMGRFEQALKEFDAARGIWERLDREKVPGIDVRDPLAASCSNTAIMLEATGRSGEALAFYRRARDLLGDVARDNPSSRRVRLNLATAHNDLGIGLHNAGKMAEAMESYRLGLALREQLEREEPADPGVRESLAASHNSLGVLFAQTGRPAEAMAEQRKALALRERLAGEYPVLGRIAGDLAASHHNIASLLGNTGRTAEALASHQKAREIQERLVREHPSSARFRSELAGTYQGIGRVQDAMGRPGEAREAYDRALPLRERLARDAPTSVTARRDLAQTLENLGRLHHQAGRLDEAMKAFDAARPIREGLVREQPSIADLRGDLALNLNNTALVQQDLGRMADAMTSLENALAIWEVLAREHPESPDYVGDLGGSLGNLARVDLREGRPDRARERLARAVDLQRKALAANPRHPVYRGYLTNLLKDRIRAAEGSGHPDEAEAARRELADLVASDPAMATLDARLAAVLNGEACKGDGERLRLAPRAYDKALFATAARLWAEALAADPKLRDDRLVQHRYNAACAAALAGCGQGKDDPPPDDDGRKTLRGQALDWLKAELTAWKRVAMTAGPGSKEVVAKTLAHWKQDADLAGIRDEKELAKLPEEERTAFKKLWSDVDALLKEGT